MLQPEEGKTSCIPKKGEAVKLVADLISEKEDKLDITNDVSEDIQEVVDKEAFVADEEWISVEKKAKKKKSKRSSQNRVDNVKDTNSIRDIGAGFFGTDRSLENTYSVNNIMGRDNEKNAGKKSRKLLLKVDEKSKIDASCTKKILSKLPRKLGSENSGIPSTTSKDIVHMASSSAIQVENDLESQYLKQGAKPKANVNSISCTDYAKKVSSVSSKYRIELEGEEGNLSSMRNKGASIAITSKDIVPTSCIDFNQESDIFGGEYNVLSKSRPVSSGLCFKGTFQYGVSSLYKEMAVRHCTRLEGFRESHFAYCIKLINRVFEVRNNKLVVAESVRNLFEELTPETEVLFFMIKVFFIVNFSILCGGRGMVDHLRYCSTYFDDQSLLDSLISEVVVNSLNRRDVLREVIGIYCKHFYSINSYEPHSGKFFQKAFDICHSLSLVSLPKEEQELVDFAKLTCMVYCGHMVSMLCRMLFYNRDVKCSDTDLLKPLKAQSFCNRCRDLRKAIIHMYHPTDKEEECLKNVGGVYIPLIIWRNCSKEIDDIIIKSVNRGSGLNFGDFVRNMTSCVKGVLLLPNTRHFYQYNIRMYDTKLKIVKLIPPLPNNRTIYSEVGNTKSL
ncbi:DUF3514 domain-containing protein [Ehrlichia sp. JZT12]